MIICICQSNRQRGPGRQVYHPQQQQIYHRPSLWSLSSFLSCISLDSMSNVEPSSLPWILLLLLSWWWWWSPVHLCCFVIVKKDQFITWPRWTTTRQEYWVQRIATWPSSNCSCPLPCSSVFSLLLPPLLLVTCPFLFPPPSFIFQFNSSNWFGFPG